MSEENAPPPKSLLGWSVVIGTVAFALLGTVVWSLNPLSDLNPCSGAVFGFFTGALFGVFADRVRRRK